jgi:chromosome segregation ATPase
MTLRQVGSSVGILCVAVIFICGCATEEKDEAAEKLVQTQERADSLRGLSAALAKEKKEIEERLQQLEEEKQGLSEQVDALGVELEEGKRLAAITESETRQESLTVARQLLESQRDSLNRDLTTLTDSIGSVKTHLSEVGERVEGLAQEESYVLGLEEEAEEKFRTGVTQIDLTLDELSRERRQALGQIALNERRISIAEKKMEAFKEEKELHENEQSRLMREQAPETDMRWVELKLTSADNEIAREQKLLEEAKLAIRASKSRIESIDSTVSSLKAKIETQYDRKDILAEFIVEEAQRLESEKNRVAADKEELLAAQQALAAEKQELERKIAELGEEIQHLEGQEVEELEGRKALLEREEAKVEAEGAAMLEATSREQEEAAKVRRDLVDDQDTSAEGRLAELSSQVAEEKAEVAKREADLAKERKQVSEEEADVAQRRAEEISGWAWVPWLIVILLLVVTIALYYIGKKVRSAKPSA